MRETDSETLRGCLHNYQVLVAQKLETRTWNQKCKTKISYAFYISDVPTLGSYTEECRRWTEQRFWGPSDWACWIWETCFVLEIGSVMSTNAGDELHRSFIHSYWPRKRLTNNRFYLKKSPILDLLFPSPTKSIFLYLPLPHFGFSCLQISYSAPHQIPPIAPNSPSL